MRLLSGFLALIWAVPLHAAPRAIEMAYVGGKVDYVDVGAKPIKARVAPWSWRNLDSFAVKYRGWSILGEYVYRVEFYYALNPHTLEGATRKVSFADISKYPDLVKRYNAIRPSHVNFVLQANVEMETRSWHLSIKVTDNDLVYFGSRSAENYSTPGSPARWRDVLSFAGSGAFRPEDFTSDAELKKVFAGFRAVSDLTYAEHNMLLTIKWPDAEIDRLGELYELYEKQGKKLKEDYAFLDDAPKEQPFAGRRDDAEPHDFRLKPGEVLRQGKELALTVNGQVVFRSSRHSYADSLDARKTHFFFNLSGNSGADLYDTKGRKLKVGGYSRLVLLTPSARGKSRVVGLPDASSVAYRTRERYFSLKMLTQREFDRFVRLDTEPQPPPRRDSGGGGLTITGSKYHYEYERGELMELDEKLNVIARETVYLPRSIQ